MGRRNALQARPSDLQAGQRAKGLGRRLDQWEDPADMYWVRVPAHARIRLRLAPRYGDPDLEIYKGSASTIYSARGRLGRSIKSGSAVDSISWTNQSYRPASIYVDTYIAAGVDALDAAYSLEVERI